MKYELIFIVKPDIEESVVKTVNESIKKTLESKKAKVLKAEDWSQKDLAYEINKYKSGFYFYYLVEDNNAEAVKEFDRVALINENIIRHVVVKIDE